jgi:hypothetical protein
LPGTSIVAILKPRIAFKLFGAASLGLEHHIYYNDRFTKNGPDLRLTRTEQKLYLQVYLEDPRRRGRYN